MSLLSRQSGKRGSGPAEAPAGPIATAKRQAPRKVSGLRKAEVVAALRSGLISSEEACEAYGLSPEEIAAWERALDSLKVRASNPFGERR
ncbi:MAG TPA: DUF1153 domain-containing protein [Allosphingosinicella sp.]